MATRKKKNTTGSLRESEMQEQATGLVPVDAAMPYDEGMVDIALDSLAPVDRVSGMIETEDGGVILSDGEDDNAHMFQGFNENLAEKLSPGLLAEISYQLLQGIESDIQSRSELTDTDAKAIEMLGLRLEGDATTDSTSGGTISRVYSPLLLESCIQYQSNFRAEMLPAQGPVKIDDQSPDNTNPVRTQLAEKLEKDMNYFLTVVAEEYVPDSDRLSFGKALNGHAFRKGYHCPIRRRPALEYISRDDLIVSNESVSLWTSGRYTHRIKMAQNVMKRMQFLGIYRDVALTQPNDGNKSAVDYAIDASQGVNSSSKLPEDTPYELYESYAEIDLKGEDPLTVDKDTKEYDNIPRPYKITIDPASREVLEVRRQWREGDENFEARHRVVEWPHVPGVGYYAMGNVHILGNTTKALTGITRMLLDSGMFENFPGFVYASVGDKQKTNQIRIPPGGGHAIDTGGRPVREMIESLPYKGPSAVLAQMAESIKASAEKMAGQVNLTGEELKANVAMGTVLALIEQSSKPMKAIHKRDCVAQQKEFMILKELLAEDPKALWRFSRNPAHQWTDPAEFEDMMLVPAADPNVPSHMHRIMMATALVARADAKPDLYNVREVEKRALITMGFQDTDSILAPLPKPGEQPPMPAKAQEIMMQSKAREEEQKREIAQDLQRGRIKMEQLRAQARSEELENKLQLAESMLDSIEKLVQMGLAPPQQLISMIATMYGLLTETAAAPIMDSPPNQAQPQGGGLQ